MHTAIDPDKRRRSIVCAARALQTPALAMVAMLVVAVAEPAQGDVCCICAATTNACVLGFFATTCSSCAANCTTFQGTMLECCENPDGNGCATVTTCNFMSALCLQTGTSPTGFCTGSCLISPTPTETPTGTPTVTPTNTPVPPGGACATPSQCSTGFCVDGVCCDSPCSDPLTKCNLPGKVGMCSRVPTAGAPALTPTALLLALVVLGGLAAIALRRRVRSPSHSAR